MGRKRKKFPMNEIIDLYKNQLFSIEKIAKIYKTNSHLIKKVLLENEVVLHKKYEIPLKNLTNQIINGWLFIEYLGKSIWKTICPVCKLEHNIKLNSIINGKVKSCINCYYKSRIKPCLAGEITSRCWDKIQKSAISRNLVLSVNPEYLWNLFVFQDKKCKYTKLQLFFAKHSKEYDRGEQTSSLDRINSNLGYIKNNVQWIHKDINKMKNNLSEINFINYCNFVANYKPINVIPYQSNFIGNHHLWKGCGELSMYYFNSLKYKANNRNLDFNISIDYAWNLYTKQGGLCKLTGLPIKLATTGKQHSSKYQTACLDRIDSSKGYIEGNVQWVHEDINQMKWNYDENYFIKLCSLVIKN